MGRQLRTTVPALPVTLEASKPNLQSIRAQEEDQRKKNKISYDNRHRARELPLLDS